MAGPDPREQFQREYPARRFAEMASAFERVASTISERKPQTQIMQVLRDAQSLCEAVASDVGSDVETTALLVNLRTAVETWRTVWPKLSKDPESGPSFRSAVVRECGLWSRRLHSLAKTTTLS